MTEVYKKLDYCDTEVIRGFALDIANSKSVMLYKHADFTPTDVSFIIINKKELAPNWAYIDNVLCFSLDKKFVSPHLNRGSKINIVIPDTDPTYFFSFWNYNTNNRVDVLHGVTHLQISAALEMMCSLGYI